MSNWHGGKGSRQRPTDKQKFNQNWDTIFGKKKVLEPHPQNQKNSKKISEKS